MHTLHCLTYSQTEKKNFLKIIIMGNVHGHFVSQPESKINTHAITNWLWPEN